MSDFARFKIFDVLTVVSFILSSVAMILVFFDGGDAKNIEHDIGKTDLNRSSLVQDKSQDISVSIDKAGEKNSNEVSSGEPVEFSKSMESDAQNSKTNEEDDLTATNGGMKNLIKDLEGVYKQDSSTAVKKQLNENTSAAVKDDKKNVHQILLKSFTDKDDAMLELNRMRLQHRDITSGIETSVKNYKQDGRQLFGVFGKINGDISLAEKSCEKFEARGVKCVIV